MAEPPNLDTSCSCDSHYCQQWPDIIKRSVKVLISSESSKVGSLGLFYFFIFILLLFSVCGSWQEANHYLTKKLHLFEPLTCPLLCSPQRKVSIWWSQLRLATFWWQFCPKNCELEERWLSVYVRMYNSYCINYTKIKHSCYTDIRIVF